MKHDGSTVVNCSITQHKNVSTWFLSIWGTYSKKCR